MQSLGHYFSLWLCDRLPLQLTVGTKLYQRNLQVLRPNLRELPLEWKDLGPTWSTPRKRDMSDMTRNRTAATLPNLVKYSETPVCIKHCGVFGGHRTDGASLSRSNGTEWHRMCCWCFQIRINQNQERNDTRIGNHPQTWNNVSWDDTWWLIEYYDTLSYSYCLGVSYYLQQSVDNYITNLEQGLY